MELLKKKPRNRSKGVFVMQDSTQVEEKEDKQTLVKVIVIITAIPYGLVMVMSYVFYISNTENDIILSTIEYYFIGKPVLFGILGVPIFFLISACYYFIRLSDLSRIPHNTTFYEVITQSTVQYGPIKIILPKLGEVPSHKLHIIEVD